MSLDWLQDKNEDNFINRGDYGIRVARPGFDASFCADNQLLFNSGWPILQIRKVIDFDSVDKETYIVEDGGVTYVDELPPGWRKAGEFPAFVGESTNRFMVNGVYAFMQTKIVEYEIVATGRYRYGMAGKRVAHEIPFTPMFIPFDHLYSGKDTSGQLEYSYNKIFLFNVDILTDVDYPYNDAPTPLITPTHDYGISSKSMFGDDIPGVNTSQFSMLVQAVKTHDSSPVGRETEAIVWSPLGKNATMADSDSIDLNNYDAYSFYSDGETDKNGGVYYKYGAPTRIYDGDFGYAIISGGMYFNGNESLVVLRTPMVSPETVEITI